MSLLCKLSTAKGSVKQALSWRKRQIKIVSLSDFNILFYYVASSAGKMNQILRCDWLPERARWSHLARSGLPALSSKKNFPKSLIINPLLTKLVRSRWLDIGLVPYGP